MDTFSFEALSVGQLQRAQFIIHSDDPQKAWFLERLVVKEGVNARKEVVFTDGKQNVQDGNYVEKILDDAGKKNESNKLTKINLKEDCLVLTGNGVTTVCMIEVTSDVNVHFTKNCVLA